MESVEAFSYDVYNSYSYRYINGKSPLSPCVEESIGLFQADFTPSTEVKAYHVDLMQRKFSLKYFYKYFC